MATTLARGLGRFALIAFGLALAEGGLWVAASVSAPVDRLTSKPAPVEPFVPDSLLGVTGSPLYHEHDPWGFRNDSVPTRVDIVTLGDSHTYGTSVEPGQEWPRRLAGLTGRTVYNLGLPTWGVLQYESVLPRALELAPGRVVVALYLGNDLFDTFVAARDRGLLETTVDAETRADVERLEAAGTIEAEARRLFRAGDPDPSTEAPTDSGVRDLLSDRSRLYGVLRAARQVVRPRAAESVLMDDDFDRAVQGVTDRRSAYVAIHEGPEWRALLSPTYRLRVLDLDDPRIRIGLDRAVDALIRMAEATRESGAELVVALLPTKEAVFAPRMRNGPVHPDLPRVWAAEDAVRDATLERLSRADVPTLDLRSALAASPAQPYFENVDGHPNADGHGVIAREIARLPSTRDGR
jgi:hypothetical protein